MADLPVVPDATTSAVLSSVDGIVATLSAVNVAIPIVAGVVTSVISIVRTLRGPAEELLPILTKLEQQLQVNAAVGQAEIARLRQEVARLAQQ